MDESLCGIEILKRGKGFVARIETQLGGEREIKANDFETVLEQLILELQEEFAGM